MRNNFRLRRDAGDILRDLAYQVLELRTGVQQFETVDHLVVMPGQRHAGPPLFPARGASSVIELRAQKTDDHRAFCLHIWDKNLSEKIIYHENKNAPNFRKNLIDKIYFT